MYIKKILLSEKSKWLQEKNNVFSFSVAPNLNKDQIKKRLLDVLPDLKIKKIRTCRYKPVIQKHRFTRKTPGVCKTKLFKKALVTVFKTTKTSSSELFLLEKEKDSEENS